MSQAADITNLKVLATRWPSGILIRKSQVSVGNIMSPLDMIWSGNKWNNIRRSIAENPFLGATLAFDALGSICPSALETGCAQRWVSVTFAFQPLAGSFTESSLQLDNLTWLPLLSFPPSLRHWAAATAKANNVPKPLKTPRFSPKLRSY